MSPHPMQPGNPLERAELRRKTKVIVPPTLAHAYNRLVKTVAEADRRGIKSPTIEAIRVLTAAPEGTPRPVQP